MLPSLTSRPFGTLPGGESVTAFTLAGSGGLSLQVITYGGIVTHLHVPDRNNSCDDVVLGFDNLAGYAAGHPFFGAIAGRVAGRISGACFTLEGKTYQLARNDPPNHLHGGLVGLDKRVWTAHPVARSDGAPSLRLTYHSPDGEEGYPGAIDIAVIYTVTSDNAFIIDSEAISDRLTPFSLTQHSYWNLAGKSADSIADHKLEIYADEAIATDENMTLLGQRVLVAGQPNDFNQSRRMGDAIPHLYKQHGDLYLVRRPNSASKLVPAARLTDPGTGRVLTVSTTEQYLQLYTGVSLDGKQTGKSGRPYRAHAGLCLECEGYPDGASNGAFGDILLQPGRPQRQTTVYAFSTC